MMFDTLSSKNKLNKDAIAAYNILDMVRRFDKGYKNAYYRQGQFVNNKEAFQV